MDESELLELAKKHGTPLFIVDHEKIRQNYRNFKKALPRVQAYYAVKANAEQEIIETLFKEGASFDVASWAEFEKVHELIKYLRGEERDYFIWDKVIFSNTIKDVDTLQKLRPFKPLVTYDNFDEVKKIKKYCDSAGLVLRVRVPDTGSMVELNTKFGADPSEASGLIELAFQEGLIVEGVSFHVGSQCTNFNNYVDAFGIVRQIFAESEKNGRLLKIVDIGGGFPAAYDSSVPKFERLADIINSEIKRFADDVEILAEPGRFMVANAATLVAQIIGRARRDGRRFYHINDGVYHTFSGVVFDHCQYHFKAFEKKGEMEICAVVGPTCDSFDKISMAENLPGELELGDYLFSENIGAYSIVSSTHFNGFPPAKVLHLNR